VPPPKKSTTARSDAITANANHFLNCQAQVRLKSEQAIGEENDGRKCPRLKVEWRFGRFSVCHGMFRDPAFDVHAVFGRIYAIEV
jgi:hypothetical protein